MEGFSFFPVFPLGGGGGTVPFLSLGDSGVTEHGVPRPSPPSLLRPHPLAAASFFFFAGATINAELIKPQLIAWRERGREKEREGKRERREGGAITALALTDRGTEGRTGFGWPPPHRTRLSCSLRGRRGFTACSVIYLTVWFNSFLSRRRRISNGGGRDLFVMNSFGR